MSSWGTIGTSVVFLMAISVYIQSFTSAGNTLKSTFSVLSLLMPVSEVQKYSSYVIFNPVLVYFSEVGGSRVGGLLHIHLQETVTPSCQECFSVAPLNLSDASL